MIDTSLYSAFGQRQVSTMYTGINQYHVVLEVLPEFQQNPESLNTIYVRSTNGTSVPLSAFTHLRTALSSLTVNHQGSFPATTLSFALAPGVALSEAVDAVLRAQDEIGMPANIHGAFAGTARAFQASLQSQPLLILTALLTVYIVLGILYESYIHPITILSTLPSAGVGALLALIIFGTDLTVIALIGIILLIGIVKKNAIMMIDFALEAERSAGLAFEAGDLPGLSASFPPDHDDHDGCLARRTAARAWHRSGFGVAPAFGHHDCRRTVAEPGSDALHDAGYLSVPGQTTDSLRQQAQVQPATESTQRRTGTQSASLNGSDDDLERDSIICFAPCERSFDSRLQADPVHDAPDRELNREHGKRSPIGAGSPSRQVRQPAKHNHTQRAEKRPGLHPAAGLFTQGLARVNRPSQAD